MRRRGLARVILVVAVVVLVSGSAAFERPRRADTGPYADGVALDASGRLELLAPGSEAELLPGSRVLVPEEGADADEIEAAAALAQEQQDWLASGWVPEGEYAELVSTALLDIHTLGSEGATIAALNANWRYVWPRDASFVAAALARTGHVGDAVETLTFLQDVQAADGSFEARYLPDGSGTPDDRHPQTDGTGWVLWALDMVAASAEPDERAEVLAALDPLLQRSTAHLLDQVDNPRSMPAASPDYWEHRESVVTLGTAGPVLAGLDAASRLHARLDDTGAAQQTASAADELRLSIEHFFAPYDYARYPGPSQPDAASAFVLPPFQPEPLPGAVAAWQASVPSMLRPAGGLAPGGGWTEINLSWTPQTALYALAAASTGDHEQARAWLDWIEAHRTPLGAIPEKVNAEGEPAGPAPLVWTCAIVVLAVAELESQGLESQG